MAKPPSGRSYRWTGRRPLASAPHVGIRLYGAADMGKREQPTLRIERRDGTVTVYVNDQVVWEGTIGEWSYALAATRPVWSPKAA